MVKRHLGSSGEFQEAQQLPTSIREMDFYEFYSFLLKITKTFLRLQVTYFDTIKFRFLIIRDIYSCEFFPFTKIKAYFILSNINSRENLFP